MIVPPPERRCAIAFRTLAFAERDSKMAFLCGLAAVRFENGEPVPGKADRLEKWFFPHIPIKRRHWRLTAVPETDPFFGHTPAQLYASGVDPVESLHSFIAFTGSDRCLAYDQRINDWREALSNLPSDEGMRLKAMNRVSLNGVFKTMERRGMPTEPIQRRIRDHDELYEYARLAFPPGNPRPLRAGMRGGARRFAFFGSLTFNILSENVYCYSSGSSSKIGSRPKESGVISRQNAGKFFTHNS